MSYYQHLPFRENIPAYALGALEAEDAAALEAHLRTCAACRDELDSYRATSDHLLIAVPPQNPSAALRKRLQRQLPGARRTARPHLNWSFGRVAAGLAIVLLAALNLFSISQVQALQRRQAQLMDQIQNGQMALAMLSYPHTQSFPIQQNDVTGSVLIDTEYNNAVLILRGLPALPADQTYQVWLIAPDETRTSAGLLRPQPDLPFVSEPLSAAQDLVNFVGVGMTIEPAGGSDSPTGLQVFRVDF